MHPLAHESDAQLLASLQANRRGASDALIDAYGPLVERTLMRILGRVNEVEDVTHDTFIRILQNVKTVRDPERLRAWIMSVTVFTARDHLRRRARGRWLWFFAPDDIPDVPTLPARSEDTDALRATYALLDQINPDDRVAFALRLLAGEKWEDIATSCRVSLATAKRRASRGEAAFRKLAVSHPVLSEWVQSGDRWGTS